MSMSSSDLTSTGVEVVLEVVLTLEIFSGGVFLFKDITKKEKRVKANDKKT